MGSIGENNPLDSPKGDCYQPRTQSYLQLPLHSFSSAQCLLAWLLCKLAQHICLTTMQYSPDSSDTQLAAGPAEAELLVHKLVQRMLR